jgi:ABC-type dipeptide/oligopeptide/nickel transport system permease component
MAGPPGELGSFLPKDLLMPTMSMPYAHPSINWLLSGVIVVEFFFAYKGFGALLLEACLNQDIYLIEACTLVAVCVAVVTQTLADVGYTYLNPRLRFEA